MTGSPAILLWLAVCAAGQLAAPPPDARRDCTACHVAWMDGFNARDPFLLIERPSERSVSSPDDCLGCHDGAVGDARDGVWREPAHGTGNTLMPGMTIPHDLPLENGAITCATCHTPHAQPSPSLAEISFIRVPGPPGALCITCHDSHATGPRRRLHPAGPEHDPINCRTCHHPHRGQQPHLLVVEPDRLCDGCHEKQARALIGAHDFTHHPDLLNARGSSTSSAGKCGLCHAVHRDPANDTGMWSAPLGPTDQPPDKRRCTGCHWGDKAKASTASVDHPPIRFAELNPPDGPGFVPLFDDAGTPSRTGRISCMTCHPPHGRPPGDAMPDPSQLDHNARIGLRTMVRPYRSPNLCSGCHGPDGLHRYLYYHAPEKRR